MVTNLEIAIIFLKLSILKATEISILLELGVYERGLVIIVRRSSPLVKF